MDKIKGMYHVVHPFFVGELQKEIPLGGCVEMRIYFFKARITRINTVFCACLHEFFREIRVIRA